MSPAYQLTHTHTQSDITLKEVTVIRLS